MVEQDTFNVEVAGSSPVSPTNFVDILKYIELPLTDRQRHLKLEEPCIEIGGYSSVEFRGLLAHHLKTTIPTGKKILCCHGCGNGQCSNPNHLYWGTYSDNLRDDYRQNKRVSYITKMKNSLSPEEFKEWHRNMSAKGGKGRSNR